MLYLSKLLGSTVVDAQGNNLGRVVDLIVNSSELFPRVTGVVYRSRDDITAMVSWRKYADSVEGDRLTLSVTQSDIRFTYLQPDEILLVRDLLYKEVIDVNTKRVVKVQDVKFSGTHTQLRLVGVEVGTRGALRAASNTLEKAVVALTSLFGSAPAEQILPWSGIDMVNATTPARPHSAFHKRLADLHPADIADILEQLDAEPRVAMIGQLPDEAAAETIAELEHSVQLEVVDALPLDRAAALLALMDPDDAADIVGGLADKTSALLAAMDPKSARSVVLLLGYVEGTAGSVMTSEVGAVDESATVAETLEQLRADAEDLEILHYVHVVDRERRLTGVVTLRQLFTADPQTRVGDIAERELITASVGDDRRDVAETIMKYGFFAIPVVDDDGKLVGMVTVDDAFDVLEELKAGDIELATGATSGVNRGHGMPAVADRLWWFIRRNVWVAIWAVTALGVSLVVPPAQGWRIAPALILLPVLLMLCDDVITSLKADIVSQGETMGGTRFWRLVARDLGVSVGLAAAFIVVAIGLLHVLFTTFDRPETPGTVGSLALAAAITIPVIVIVGAFMGQSMGRAYKGTGSLSATRYSITLMIIGTAVHLVLTSLVSALAARLFG